MYISSLLAPFRQELHCAIGVVVVGSPLTQNYLWRKAVGDPPLYKTYIPRDFVRTFSVVKLEDPEQ